MQYLNANQAAEIFGVTRATFLRTIKTKPNFPKPCGGSSRKNLQWFAHEIHEWRRQNR